jgi:putative transposase
MVALAIMPDHVRLLVKAHPVGSPFHVASQITGFTSRWLRAEFPHLRLRLPALWSRWYCAAPFGAMSAETVRRCLGTRDGRLWRQEQAR